MLRPRLKAYCDVQRLSELAPMEPAGDGEEVVQAPLENLAAMPSLLKDVDAVLHFGGVGRRPGVVRRRPLRRGRPGAGPARAESLLG